MSQFQKMFSPVPMVFWLNATKPSLEAIWNNPEDDIYAEQLQGEVPTGAETV
jgi:hypothetical protein